MTDNTPLRGEKGALYEGGIRVPLIVKFPALVKPGTTCSVPAISYDFFPTFSELAGADLPAHQTIDGISLLPLLENPKATLGREAIHFHFPHYHHSRPASAIRKGPWKLIDFLDGSDPELYNLAEDISEEQNLAGERKGLVAALNKELQDWRVGVGARMPIRNPSYDESRADEWWNRRTGEPLTKSPPRKPFPKTEKEMAKATQ